MNEGRAAFLTVLRNVCSVAAFKVFPLVQLLRTELNRALFEPLEDDDTAESAGGGLRGLRGLRGEPTALSILVHPRNISGGSFKATFN